MIVSVGIIEAERDGEEFGLDGVSAALQQASPAAARDLCLTILHAARQFMRTTPTHNNVIALALLSML